MSRSGYSDEYDDEWAMIRWRGAVTSAIRGKRGQSFLWEILYALDEMPIKRLVAGELEEAEVISFSHWGMFEIEGVCAIGSVGKKRGVDMRGIDPEDSATVAGKFNISEALAREIVFINDDDYSWRGESPEERFRRVRRWVASQIHTPRPERGNTGSTNE